MNWTGGRLQRHSRNSTNAVVAKQKQHFAKARTKLQTHESPQNIIQFRPNFLPLEEPALATRLMPLEQYRQRRIGHIRERHTALNKSEDTAALDHRFPSTKDPRPYPYKRTSPSSISHRCDRRHKTQSGRIFTQSHHREVTVWSEYEKRQAEDPSTEEDLLEAKRKQLLRQHDWLGLHVSRPVQMDFSTRDSREMIGKRRKICHDSQNRTTQWKNVSNLPSAINNVFSKDERFMYSMSVQEPESIEVRIGTAALRSQATPDREPIGQSDYSPQHQSSESMLLKAQIGREHTILPRHVSEANNEERSDVDEENSLGSYDSRTSRDLSDGLLAHVLVDSRHLHPQRSRKIRGSDVDVRWKEEQMEHGLAERERCLRWNHKLSESILRDAYVDTHTRRQRQEMEPSDLDMVE